MALSVSVEAFDGSSAAPCAVVIIEGLDSAGTTVAVRRTVAGQTVPVRGGRNLVVYGAGSLVDYDVPVGVDAAYTVTLSDGAVLSAAYRVDSPYGWLADPYDPSIVVPFALRPGAGADVVLMAESLAEMSVDASSEVSSVIGSRYPVAVGGTRQAPSGVTIGLAALTSEASAAVRSLIESSPLVVVRPPVGIPALDPVSYLLLPELKPAFPMRRRGGALTTFTTTGQLVRPVSKPVVWARWTYESVAGIYVGEDGVTPLTYDEVQAIATSAGVEYAAVERDPRMGGAL